MSAKVTRTEIAAWSLVSVVATMMMIPLNAVIPAFYAEHTSVSLATIGTVLFVARLYDAFADPTIGFLSDRTRSRIGRRKPWQLAGGVLAAISGWFLFNPSPEAGGLYFFIVVVLFYTAYTMLTVPHSAWGSELTRDYADRSSISGLLTFAGVVGLLLFMGLPVLLSSPLLQIFPSAEMTPDMLKFLGWLLVAAIPICVLIPVFVTPRGVEQDGHSVKLSQVWAAIRVNPPFWVFVAAYMFSSLGYGVYYATTYLFLDDYLGLASAFPLIYATGALVQLLCIPFWTWLSQRVERHRIWALGIGIFGLLLPVRLLLPEGDPGFPFLMAIVVCASIANAASQVPQMAVLADCIDHAEMKLGVNLAGTHYALQQLVLKASLAAGGGAAFFALAAINYDAKAQAHSEESLLGLANVHTFAPLALFAVAGVILWFFPISRKRQAETRAKIDALRAAGQA